MIRITRDQLKKFAPRATDAAIEALTSDAGAALLVKHGITDTSLRLCHALAQWAWETAGFQEWEENLHYSAAGLRRVFPRYFNSVQAIYYAKRGPEAIANRVYDDRNPARINKLGNTRDGDGWGFRGRGFMHTTGREGYARAAQVTGLDLLAKPDLLSDPAVSLVVACDYWTRRGVNKHADRDTLEAVTRIINGGLNGLDGRRQLLAKAKEIFGNKFEVAAPKTPGVLQEGAAGDAIRLVQQRLTALGYPVTADGVYGPLTRNAVMAFKADNAVAFISATASDIDRATREALFSPAAHHADVGKARLEFPEKALADDPTAKAAGAAEVLGKAVAASSVAAAATAYAANQQTLPMAPQAWWAPMLDIQAWLHAAPWLLALVAGAAIWWLATLARQERARAAATGQYVGGGRARRG